VLVCLVSWYGGLFYSQSISEKNMKVGKVEGNGFEVELKYCDIDYAVDYLKKVTKKWGGDVSTSGNYVEGKNSMWKDFSTHPFDIYYEIERRGEQGAILRVVVYLGGAYLSSKMHPDMAKKFKDWLKDVASRLQVSALEERLNAENKKLKKMIDEKSDMEKRVKKMKEEIEECEKKIKENNNAINDYTKKIQDKDKEISEQQKVVDNLQKLKKEIQ